MKYLLATLPCYCSIGFALQCPVDELAQYTWNDAMEGAQIAVEADDSSVSKQTAVFRGNVVAKRGQEVFYTDHITYQRDSGDIQTSAPMTYGTPDFAIRAEQADYSLNTESGSFRSVEYFLKKNNVIGEAEQIDIDRKANTEDLQGATYSTCPRLSRSWSIKAKRVHLDHDNGVGTARGTTFRLADVPVFYFPYFSFPLDDRRKTGFLLPSINLSEGRGLDITTPFYLNIAPNHDATLSPRVMSKRGFMLGGEYRYLLPQWQGIVSGTYLPSDRKYKDKRWSFKTSHHYRPNDQFFLSASYQRISDKNYIEDFEDTLDLSNVNFLESHLDATYLYSPNFRLTATLKDYQVANSAYTETDKPYSVLPRLSATGHWRYDNGVVLSTDSELSNFDKDNTVSGWRLDQALTAKYAFERSYGFIKPSATYRFTGYQLRNQSSGIAKRHTRALPTFSLDNGLYFDRQMTWFGNEASQSLEPRLFYLYTPYHNQSDLPDFDTSAVDSSYESMFLTNRFVGKDRIGDANQLTTAVSSKITDNHSGKELASIAIGQIQYFEDRRVSLLDSVADASRSNVITEGRVSLRDDLRLRGLAHYDLDKRHAEKTLLGITYTPESDKAISVSHLYDENYYKQLDFAGVWRIDDHWRAFWRWNYSIEHDKTIDVFAGVEFADCCWGMRFIARQQRHSLTKESNAETKFYLEFALKGLGNIGSDTTTMLRDVVPNYRSINYEKPQ